MKNLSDKQKIEIRKLNSELEKQFPNDAMSGSYSSVWGAALRAGVINVETCNLARAYYGRLWNYSGD